tara:strand:+ start:8440 stop:8700 length:261 start_codon:yes stop_codon:yes gene_type:complete
MTHEEMMDEAQRREENNCEWIDDCFRVWETRYGMWSSETKEGRKMLTGMHKDNVIIMTRWHLKCEQEGWPEGSVRVVNSAVMGVKL